MTKYTIVIDRSGYKSEHKPVVAKDIDDLRKKVLKSYATVLKDGSNFIDVYTGKKGAYSRSGVLHGKTWTSRNGFNYVDPKTGRLM